MKTTFVLGVVWALVLTFAAAYGEEGLPISCKRAREIAAQMSPEQIKAAKRQAPADYVTAAKRCGIRL